MAKGLGFTFIGQIPGLPSDQRDTDAPPDNFRQVPDTDVGNRAYRDEGMRGNYAPPEECYGEPKGLLRFTGYGADRADLERGYVEPVIREDPAFDLSNYKDRFSDPKRSNEDFGNTDQLQNDYEFRNRNRQSRGFLTRPRLPTERG